MKIIISGNIGSGKTTILKKLNQHFRYDEIIIDDFRIKYGDDSLDGEFLARDNFFLSIQKGKNQFIECTGVGEVAVRLCSQIVKYDEEIFLLTLLASKEACAKRVESRIWNIPFPFKKEPLFSKLTRFENEINLNTNWKKLLQKNKLQVILKKNETIEDVDLIVQDIVSLIKKFQKA